MLGGQDLLGLHLSLNLGGEVVGDIAVVLRNVVLGGLAQGGQERRQRHGESLLLRVLVEAARCFQDVNVGLERHAHSISGRIGNFRRNEVGLGKVRLGAFGISELVERIGSKATDNQDCGRDSGKNQVVQKDTPFIVCLSYSGA